jgi:8-oxo-dGTP pyrophosphatase MutT (NUDIX family)
MKFVVCALIFNNNGEILAVSRKDNHTDFGLAGGKVDDIDFGSMEHTPLMAALVREVKEETGIDINPETTELVFAIHKDGYMGYTYLVREWSGEISTTEPHVVKFTHFEEIMNGSFGRYNSLVAESLTDLGFSFKIKA